MTIFYFFYEYLTEGLGGLSHIWEVSRHLHQQGHRVVIFAPRCGNYRVKTPVEIIYVPTIDVRFFRFLSFHFLLLFYAGYYMIRNKVDILYVREMALSLTPFVLAKIFHKPMITEINGDLLTEYQYAGWPSFLLGVMRLVEITVCRASQAVVCVTEGLRDIFQTRYHLSPKKLKVIPNGTDPDLFHPLDRGACRKRLGIDPKIKVVGFIGTFVPHQGLSYLIKSSSIILKESPGVVFLLVGDGPMRKDIMEMIQAMDLMDRFLLPGGVPQAEVVFFINTMDICVAPFTRERNERIGISPLKIYDYLACGKPVVASDIKGAGDLLRENEVGIPVTPEDPASLARGVLLALEDQDLAIRCLQKAPAIIKRSFTWQITTKKIAEVCFTVLR
ncbi:MAG: glycosyltransferase family 4 protein [Deltaproteobacteria bacterium]|nr:glycosyltransferase family 4 protein [Deltaproteobacteria bacterium]